MPVKVGNVVEGTVTGITNFGAFIQMEEGETGLVHISEISEDYVNNVADYLEKKQKVKVKVLSIDNDGKISLSIRQAKPKRSKSQPMEVDLNKNDPKEKFMSFEDKLNKFLKDSNERLDQLKSRDSKKGSFSKSR